MLKQSLIIVSVLILASNTGWSQNKSYRDRANKTLAVLQHWYNEDTGLWETTSW